MVIGLQDSIKTVSGVPYIFLKNKAPTCFQIAAKRGQTLLVKCHAPDLVLTDDNPAREREAITSERKLEDGLDAMYVQ